jgi:hypothetical protein
VIALLQIRRRFAQTWVAFAFEVLQAGESIRTVVTEPRAGGDRSPPWLRRRDSMR